MVDKILDVSKLSISETLDTALKLKGKEQEEFAEAVMAHLKEVGGHGASNLGYFIGYYDAKDRKKLQKLFPVEHPIFGKDY